MNDIDYRNKKEDILSKFDKSFIDEYYMRDSMFHQILEVLTRDDNPYKIIEHLVKDRVSLIEQNQELMKFQPPPVYIVKDKNALS